MPTVQNIFKGVSNITNATDIVFSEETAKFLALSNITDINQIEFWDGLTCTRDMIEFYDNKITAISSFMEVCIKASLVSVYFKDYSNKEDANIYTYIKKIILTLNERCNSIENRRLIALLNRCKKFMEGYYTAICDLDFMPSTIKSLTANNITKVSQLISYSRDDLINMNQIGQATVDDIINVLKEFNILLKNDDFYTCKYCKTQFISCVKDGEEIICQDCMQRLKRLKKNTSLKVELQVKDASWDDEGDGFIIYANVINKTNTIQTLTLKEAYILGDNRQYNYNAYVTGYRFYEEDVFPRSFKTAGRIWYEKHFKYGGLSLNDELYLVFQSESNGKIYFKFVYGEDDKFVLYDILTK